MLKFTPRLFCSKALVLKPLRYITSTSAQILRIDLIAVVERQELGRRLWAWPPPAVKCPFWDPRSTRFLSLGSRKDFYTWTCIFFLQPFWPKSGCFPLCISHKQRICTYFMKSLQYYPSAISQLHDVTHYFEKLVINSGVRGPNNWIRCWYLALLLKYQQHPGWRKTDQEGIILARG